MRSAPRRTSGAPDSNPLGTTAPDPKRGFLFLLAAVCAAAASGHSRYVPGASVPEVTGHPVAPAEAGAEARALRRELALFSAVLGKITDGRAQAELTGEYERLQRRAARGEESPSAALAALRALRERSGVPPMAAEEEEAFLAQFDARVRSLRESRAPREIPSHGIRVPPTAARVPGRPVDAEPARRPQVRPPQAPPRRDAPPPERRFPPREELADTQRFQMPLVWDGWPRVVNGGRYGASRNGGARRHGGLDFAVPEGTPVLPSRPGRVVMARWAGGYGNLIIVEHEDGMRTYYAHLSSMNVRRGQWVDRTMRIGRVGNTGHSRGAHLHFEVRDRRGRTLDPEQVLRHRPGRLSFLTGPRHRPLEAPEDRD